MLNVSLFLLNVSLILFNFLEKNVLKKAEGIFKVEDEDIDENSKTLKLLVLPGLPTADPHRSESIKLLREHGIDGIISFRSMLLDILAKVHTNHNYQKSEILQIMRILKNYNLIKEPQMDLFAE